MARPSLRIRAARGAAGAVVVLCGVAGIAKLLDLATFSDAVDTWSLVPRVLRPFLVVAIPLVEVGLLFAWVCMGRRRQIELLVFLMLVAFSAAYGTQAFLGRPPVCGCLGALSQFVTSQSEVRWVTGRNVALLSVLAAGLLFGRNTGGTTAGAT